jgi:hypothetical protein
MSKKPKAVSLSRSSTFVRTLKEICSGIVNINQQELKESAKLKIIQIGNHVSHAYSIIVVDIFQTNSNSNQKDTLAKPAPIPSGITNFLFFYFFIFFSFC